MAAAPSGQLFAEPENDHHIMASWERFLNGDEGGSDALRRLIDDSWRRCQGASVDPAIYQAPPPIKENSLHSLQTECSELLTASTPVMASARDFLAETGTVMVLTDQSGTILNLEGDMSTRGAAEDVHLLSGANWSELACGTNAIGTALAVGHAGADPLGRALLCGHQALVLRGHRGPRPLRQVPSSASWTCPP
jgi:transcriptional regulator of acetoin/glycerol metabolism